MSDMSSSGTIPTNIPHTNPSASGNNDFSYNYSLNHSNQSRRLIQSALKPPISVTYNNIRMVDNIKHTLNANIECSSGLYLTAIKPVLEQVTDHWSADLGDHVLTCSKISNRNDHMARHLLCTQLSLHLSKKSQQYASSHSLTLHFYHTKDKILVQSSSIVSPGVSAASWLVKNFIEPLAAKHIANNQQSISEVNNAIISSVTSQTCKHCNLNINPTASHVKDQPLSCNRCTSTYHKRCTSRRGNRGGNWSKAPWLCPPCIQSDGGLHVHAQDRTQHVQARSTILPSRAVTEPAPNLTFSMNQSHVHDPQNLHQTTGQTLLTLPSSPPEAAGVTDQHPAHQAQPLQHSPPQAGPPTQVALAQPSPPQPVQAMTGMDPTVSVRVSSIQDVLNTTEQRRFPNNAIRQRGSNVVVTNPEIEFQKTQLDACRSTIVQQEAEIKKLSEALDLRNKKIMQLEGQVTVAASSLSSRESSCSSSSPVNSSHHLRNLIDTIQQLIEKLTVATDPLSSKGQTVNVFSNSSSKNCIVTDKGCQTSNLSSESHNQTEAVNNEANDSVDATVTFPSDGIIATANSETQQSTTEACDESAPIEIVLNCTICNQNFLSSTHLNNHLETAHGTNSLLPSSSLPNSQQGCSNRVPSYYSCHSCMFRFQTHTQLTNHVKECHESALKDPVVSRRRLHSSNPSPAASKSTSL